MSRKLLFSLLVSVPILLLAFSGVTPSGYTGAPADGGNTCASCHNTFGNANSDSQGSLTIMAAGYQPGAPQTIRVIVKHPTASRWGYQLTARSVNNPAAAAGTFTATSDVTVICSTNAPAPCNNGGPEFAEDTLAPITGVVGSEEFDVVWNPPASEVGRIVFYASAVAADGDGKPDNDRVYTASQTVSLSSGASCSVSSRPVLRNAANGASFQPQFSPGAMLTLFGAGFQASGYFRVAGPGDFIGNAFPTVLGCVGVQINGEAAPLTYVSATQINLQVPDDIGSGPVTLVIAVNAGRPNELRSDVATLNNVQPYAPAFFVFSNNSVAAQFANTSTPVADPIAVPGGRPAKPGDIVTVYGTGFGATSPAVAAGAIASGVANVTQSVTVTVGGVVLGPSDVSYAGLSPGSISGLYQFNIRIPASTPAGNIPISIQIGGDSTQNGVTIPITSSTE